MLSVVSLVRKVSLSSWEMAFLVRCYANCLQPWSSKVSDVIIFGVLFFAADACVCVVFVLNCALLVLFLHLFSDRRELIMEEMEK